MFPFPGGERYEPFELPREGRIWSWTIQRFRPKTPPYAGPEAFEPFAIGYVELPDAVIVESPLTGIPFEALRIGLPVKMVLVPLNTDAAGRTIMTYAFTAAKNDHG